jgi:hypothetical protein
MLDRRHLEDLKKPMHKAKRLKKQENSAIKKVDSKDRFTVTLLEVNF